MYVWDFSYIVILINKAQQHTTCVLDSAWSFVDSKQRLGKSAENAESELSDCTEKSVEPKFFTK